LARGPRPGHEGQVTAKNKVGNTGGVMCMRIAMAFVNFDHHTDTLPVH